MPCASTAHNNTVWSNSQHQLLWMLSHDFHDFNDLKWLVTSASNNSMIITKWSKVHASVNPEPCSKVKPPHTIIEHHYQTDLIHISAKVNTIFYIGKTKMIFKSLRNKQTNNSNSTEQDNGINHNTLKAGFVLNSCEQSQIPFANGFLPGCELSTLFNFS